MPPCPKGELNERSQQLYELWDGQLNELWDCLEQRLDPAEMEALTAEELEWISWKEEQIGQAGEELGACSLRLMIQPQRGAELTRDRVYELLDWLDRNEGTGTR